MPSLLHKLTLYQMGKETTRGTAVPATSKIAVEQIDFMPEDEMYRPNLAKGLLLPHSGDETPIKRLTRWKVTDQPVVYNQHQNWLSMGVDGGVTAVGASDPWAWTFTRSILADPAPDTWTLERRMTDGTNHADNEWAYCFLSQLKWVWEINQPLKFSAEGFARRIQTSTLTAALAMPVITIPPAQLGKLWLDAAWANLGTTQVVGELRKIDCTFNTGLKPVDLIDGRTDLDYSTYVIDADEVGIELSLDVLLTKARYDAERAAAEAGTLRAIRAKIEGPLANRSLQLDMLVKHTAASMFEVGEEDGQVSANFKMQEATDATNFFSAILTNGVGVYA